MNACLFPKKEGLKANERRWGGRPRPPSHKKKILSRRKGGFNGWKNRHRQSDVNLKTGLLTCTKCC